MDIPPNLTSLAKSRKKESCNGFFTHQSISQFSICAFYAKWALQMFKYEHIGWRNLKTFFFVKDKFWCLQLFASLSRETKDTQANYSMLSIKHLVLLNVLIWIFPKKFQLNDLVYLKFWESQYMKMKEV